MSETENLPPPGEEEQPAAPPQPEPQPQPEPVQTPEGQEPAEKPAQEAADKQRRPRDRKAESIIAWKTAQIAERDAQLAQRDAQLAELQRQLTLSRESGLSASEGGLTAALAGTEMDLERAKQAGDVRAEIAAQRRLAELAAELAQVKRDKLLFKQPEPEEERRQHPQIPPEPPQRAQTSHRTEQWLEANPWFQTDPQMHVAAKQAAVAALKRGIENDSEEYWSFVDRRMRHLFPDEFDGEAQPKPTGPAPAAVMHRAPVVGQPNQKQPIRLTQEQIDFAKALLVDPKVFAANLAARQKAGQR